MARSRLFHRKAGLPSPPLAAAAAAERKRAAEEIRQLAQTLDECERQAITAYHDDPATWLRFRGLAHDLRARLAALRPEAL
jgi:hypothetical protein